MFREIKLEDKQLFKEFSYSNYYGSELNFQNIYAWKEYDNLSIYNNDNMLIVKGKDFFFPPLVRNINYSEAIDFICNFCKENNFPFNIYGITVDLLPFFNFENTIIHKHEELNEYLYIPSDLITYSGKRFHSKRNLLNQFKKKYQYEFVSYDSQLLDGIINIIDLWTDQKSLTYEKEGILSILNNLSNVECFCDCILIDGKVEAFSIGTISNNIGIVLFEKANTNFIGIYAAIVNLFASKHFNDLLYINRQEDMGIENLRISKMSYNPIGFVYKYQLTQSVEYQLYNIYKEAFNDSEAYMDFFFKNKEKEVRYLLNNNSITSSLYFRYLDLSFNNEIISSAFIFGAATSKVYKNNGYMKTLITDLFNEIRDNTSIIYLNAAVENFYEKFDFIPFGIKPVYNNNYKEIPCNDFSIALNLYNEYSKNFNIYTIRNIDKFTKYIEEIKIDGGMINLLSKEENIVGYIIKDEDSILEYCNLEEKVNSKENYNMIRIINLSDFLEKIKYKPNRNLKVIDSFIPQNNIQLVVNDDEIHEINIKDFTQELIKNYKSLVFEKY